MEVSNVNNYPDKETLKKLLNGEIPDNDLDRVVEEIKLNQPIDEFGSGIKRYLKDHDYDSKKIIVWHQLVQKNAEQRIQVKRNLIIRQLLKAAAVLIIGLGVYSALNDRNKTIPSWESFYAKDVGFPVFMEGRSDLQWMEYYRASNHSESMKLIDQQLETKVQNDTLLYYKIVCMFELGMNMNNASLSMPKDTVYLQKARLILAYSYWKIGRFKDAREEFDALSYSNIEYISNQAKLGKEALKGLD